MNPRQEDSNRACSNCRSAEEENKRSAVKVKKSAIPADSLVGKYLPADYSDVYTCEVYSAGEVNSTRSMYVAPKLSPDDVTVAFWTGGPAWVGALFRLRNFLVRFVGLKGSKKNDQQEFEKFIHGGVGSERGFMSIAAKNDRETVLLLTDKHLDAYMSVYAEDVGVNTRDVECAGKHAKVYVITLVHFKNRLGWVYFFVIRPFHALVVKSMLKRAVNQVATAAAS